MHLLTYTSFINNSRPVIAIQPVVVWQNALLSYNLMSATIPTLKGFVKGFTTGGVGYTEDMSAGRSSGNNTTSFQLRSLSKSKTKAALVPEGYTECEAQVTSVQRNPSGAGGGRGGLGAHEAPRERSRSNQEENASIVSYDSRRIMLKREWAVSRE